MTLPVVLHAEEVVNADNSTIDKMHEAMEQMMGWGMMGAGPIGMLIFFLFVVLLVVVVVALINYLRPHYHTRVDDDVLEELRRLRREIRQLKEETKGDK